METLCRFKSGKTGRAGTWDLTEHGMPYALAVGPYGALLALTWQRNTGGVNLVQLDRQRPGAKICMKLGLTPV